MSTFLATSNPLIRDLAITRYELSFVSESLYTSASVTLYFSEILTPDILVTLRKWQLGSIWILEEADIISGEHELGDIILPNVFLPYDDQVAMIEFDKTTRDSMLKEAIFLETYERQADMDFQVFGVSLGGISVTKSSPLVEHDREQIDFAYSADCTDQYLYPLLLESQKIDLLGDLAPVLVITGKDSDPSDRNKLLSHLFPVLEYFAGTAPISGVGVEDTVPDIDDDYTEDEDDEFYNTPDRVSPHL